VGGLEVDEQPQHFVVDSERLGIGSIDLVDRDDRTESQRKRLPSDESGLRHGTLGGIHQDQDPIHHPENPLDLAAEVGVAWSVDDVDLGAVPPNGRILGKNGDAALPLERVRVHDALFHLLVGSECPGLPEHLVHQSGLSMIDVGDDRQVTNQSARFLPRDLNG
jgi:hypothetical protein